MAVAIFTVLLPLAESNQLLGLRAGSNETSHTIVRVQVKKLSGEIRTRIVCHFKVSFTQCLRFTVLTYGFQWHFILSSKPVVFFTKLWRKSFAVLKGDAISIWWSYIYMSFPFKKVIDILGPKFDNAMTFLKQSDLTKVIFTIYYYDFFQHGSWCKTEQLSWLFK